ncbi:GrpB family protein [Metabacillus sp. GX 13764]|uniref:GrpB family protein n=1 Tax=Metabacillus kandeliae TaxID=2900151 RepID=UPI001E2D997C|nr:GrpB family protein [Metabacillus kandeliae]MCD7035685.1 GrpB family protein [Metabacillus kandeliae]
MRKVTVVPYEESWKQRYEEEADQLKKIFGSELAGLHHIGSTSVKGLKAKPVIDIMLEAKNIRNIDRYNGEMAKLGYEPMGEFGIPGRRYFRKGGDERTRHVHVFEEKSSHATRHLAFRNYLRAHPDAMEQYGALKEKLAAQFPDNMDAYIEGKAKWVLDTEAKAVEWFKNRKEFLKSSRNLIEKGGMVWTRKT